MPSGATRDSGRITPARRGGRRLLLGFTLLVVVAAMVVSSSLVVYTAWLHDLKNGAFALVFAVLSAKTGFDWFLWREEPEEIKPTPE